jgi:formate/nitrite transporter
MGSVELYNPTQMCDNYAEGSLKKAASPAWRLLLLGFAAGMFIGLGAVASSTAAHAISDVGMARLITGLVFPVGLCLVVILGTELFTGNALMVTAALKKTITWRSLARNWVLVYIGNLAGALVLAALIAYFGQLDIGAKSLAVYTAKVAAAKNSLPWENAFVLGIFCNILVCAAVYLGNSSKDTAGKILGLYLPVMAFVVAGFEHCIANMYYIPAGIFANMNPAYTQLIAEANINTAVLNFGTFITANLIPVTLGNIVGGVLVGLMMYFSHGTREKKR